MNNAFVMQCDIEPSGAWKTKPIGCMTPGGKRLNPGGSHLSVTINKVSWSKISYSGMTSIGMMQFPLNSSNLHSNSNPGMRTENNIDYECTRNANGMIKLNQRSTGTAMVNRNHNDGENTMSIGEGTYQHQGQSYKKNKTWVGTIYSLDNFSRQCIHTVLRVKILYM